MRRQVCSTCVAWDACGLLLSTAEADLSVTHKVCHVHSVVQLTAALLSLINMNCVLWLLSAIVRRALRFAVKKVVKIDKLCMRRAEK